MDVVTSIDGALGLVVRFIVKEGSEAAFDELTRTTVEQVHRSEPGTLLYLCHQVDGAQRERIFYELYRDLAAFDAHESQPHIQRFLAERDEFLEGFEVDFLAPTVHAGILGER